MTELKHTARIMIVEDEGITAVMLKDMLTFNGYVVQGTYARAETALEMLAKYPQNRTDLIITDIRLKSAMTGIELAAEVRRLYQIPVIFATAHDDQKTVQEAKMTYPYGYLVKPYDADEVAAKIEIGLERSRQDQRIRDILRVGMNAFILVQNDFITEWNPVAEEIFEWSESEALGQPFEFILADRYQASYRQSMEGMDGGSPVFLEAHGKRRDGTEFPMEMNVGCFDQPDCGTLVVVVRDISMKRQLIAIADMSDFEKKAETLTGLIALIRREDDRPRKTL